MQRTSLVVIALALSLSAPTEAASSSPRARASTSVTDDIAPTRGASSTHLDAKVAAKDAAKEVPADDEASSDDVDPSEDEGGFWGFVYAVNEWYPIVLDKDLEPEVDEKVVWLWVTTVACGPLCGPLWIPMLIVGEDPGMEYFAKEALIAIVLEMVTYVIGGATTSIGGLGSILITANLCYLAPVSLINTYDRALKRQRAKGESDDVPAKESASSTRAPAVAMRY